MLKFIAYTDFSIMAQGYCVLGGGGQGSHVNFIMFIMIVFVVWNTNVCSFKHFFNMLCHIYTVQVTVRAILNHLYSKKYLYSVQSRQLKQQEGALTKIRGLHLFQDLRMVVLKHDGCLYSTSLVFIL